MFTNMSCEQELCEPISLSLERALGSEIGSQDPCSARSAAPALQRFMLLWRRKDFLTHLVDEEDVKATSKGNNKHCNNDGKLRDCFDHVVQHQDEDAKVANEAEL